MSSSLDNMTHHERIFAIEQCLLDALTPMRQREIIFNVMWQQAKHWTVFFRGLNRPSEDELLSFRYNLVRLDLIPKERFEGTAENPILARVDLYYKQREERTKKRTFTRNMNRRHVLPEYQESGKGKQDD